MKLLGEKSLDEKREVNYTYIRSIIFIIIGILICQGLQIILVPKRFPYTKSYDFGKLPGYYNEERDSLDVIMCGASHVSRGILPMELYELYGIKSYNLATSGQTLELSYYLLCEALKTQTPRLFILDVSALYNEQVIDAQWTMLLDDMKFGKNKIEAARCYRSTATGVRETVFPLLRYHTRWKQLDDEDFIAIFRNKNYYGKGGQIQSVIHGGGMSVELMNSVAEEMVLNNEKIQKVFNGDRYSEEKEKDVLYNTNISEKNIKVFLDIKRLCDKNNVEFLALKVPAVYWPNTYSSSWTKEKYNQVKTLCDKHNINYYDLLYEADINLDLEKDSEDWGIHLNLNGAQKVSANLGEFIEKKYKLPNDHNACWDKDLLLYQQVRSVAQLQLQQDFVDYINMLISDYKESKIVIVGSSDMTSGLNEEEINILKELGLQVNFSDASKNAYIAIIDDGEILYEALSNRQLSYEGICGSNKIKLYSASWWKNSVDSSNASIRIGNSEYVYGGNGIHILVYDEKRNLILDSVCFDTSSEYHFAVRSDSITNKLMEEFEQYSIEMEDKLDN